MFTSRSGKMKGPQEREALVEEESCDAVDETIPTTDQGPMPKDEMLPTPSEEQLFEELTQDESIDAIDHAFLEWRVDYNYYKPFMPNLGDLDPSVSLISSGRKLITKLNYQIDEFHRKYGYLTTDLGYGIIYSIILHAVETDGHSVESAWKEASVRSGDPLLCIAVARDYCARKAILFEKFRSLTPEVLSDRKRYYPSSRSRSENHPEEPEIDFNQLPPLSTTEKMLLNQSNWLFNGKVLEIYPTTQKGKEPIYLMVKIPTLRDSQIIREFNKKRHWKLKQNVVVQWDGDNQYRVLDFQQ